MPLRYWLIGLAALCGAIGLGLDFYVISGTMVAQAGNPVPRSFPSFLVYYLTFLTNLSNVGLLLVYLGETTRLRGLGWFRQPATRAGMAGIMLLVMFFYHFMLAPHYSFSGLIVPSNYLLHYVTPVLYLAWWLACAPHGALRYRDVPWMLVPGLAYVGWVLLRGLIAGEYPYTIIDPTFAAPGQPPQGYAGVAIGVGVLVVLVAIADVILTAIDGMLARRPQGDRGMP